MARQDSARDFIMVRIHSMPLDEFKILRFKKKDKKISKDKTALIKGLEITSKRMAETLNNVFSENKIRGYKSHPTAFFAQMISHESHHQGQILATVTKSDFELSKSFSFGLCTWNTK